MRRIVIATGIVVAVLILVVGGFLLSLDINKYSGVIQGRLEQQLQRKVTLGKMNLGLIPLRFQVQSPTIAEDPRFGSSAPFVRADGLNVKVALLPLISGNVAISSLELRKPVVELIKDRGGVWNFSSIGPQPGAGGAAASGQSSAGSSLSLDRLQITDGQIAVTDNQARQPRAVYDHVDITLLNYAPGKPFTVDIGTNEIRLKGEGGPVADANPAATPFRGTLTLTHFDLSRAGKDAAGFATGDTQINSQGGNLTATGKMKLDAVKLNKLDLGYPITLDFDAAAKPADGLITINRGDIQLGPTPVSITGSVNSNANPVTINLALKSGDVSITEIARLASAFGVAFDPGTQVAGKIAVNMQAKGSVEKPAVSGTIAGRDLQISGKGIPQPIQVQALDVAMSPTEIRSNEFNATTGKTTVAGRFAIKQYLAPAPSLDVGLRAPNATLPEIQSMAKAYGVTSLEQIQGQGALNLDLRAAGTTDSLASANAIKLLNGTLNLDFSPLSIKGFDVARELAVIGGFGSSDKKDTTDLLHVVGRILIKDGVAQTDDLKAQLPVGNLAASGTANLATEALNLKLSSVFSKEYTDKVGGSRIGGYMTTAFSNSAGELVIPAIVTGTMKQPKFAPDTQAMVQLQKQKVTSAATSAVSGLIGSLTGGAKEEKSEKPSVKGFLGGLLGKKSGSPLAGTSWQWTKTSSSGKTVTPKDPSKFVLRFSADGKLSSTTDCNSVSGAYTANESKLAIDSLVATKMFCQGSQESAYTTSLQESESYAINGDTLTINLKGNAGVMSFRKN